jgi:hypothetical protein
MIMEIKRQNIEFQSVENWPVEEFMDFSEGRHRLTVFFKY